MHLWVDSRRCGVCAGLIFLGEVGEMLAGCKTIIQFKKIEGKVVIYVSHRF